MSSAKRIMDGKSEPPEKRRKTDSDTVADDLWGDDDEDDDFILSQMDLERVTSGNQQISKRETNNNMSSIVYAPSYYNSRPLTNTGSNKFPKPVNYGQPSSQMTMVPNGSAYHCNSGKVPSGLDVNKYSPVAGTTPQTTYTASVQKKLHQVEDENKVLKNENVKLKECQYGKDGQIKVLRTKVAQLEAERSRDKHEKMLRKESELRERSNREIQLQSDLDKLKSALQFKEKELQEAQEQYKRLQRQPRPDRSPSHPSGFPSPSHSPRHRPHPPFSPHRTPTKTGGFPTPQTFAEVSPKCNKNNTSRKVSLSQEVKVNVPPTKPPVLRLKTYSSKGHKSGPELVHIVLEKTTGGIGSVMNLLQTTSPMQHICDNGNDTHPKGNTESTKENTLQNLTNLAQDMMSSLLLSNQWTTTIPCHSDTIKEAGHIVKILPLIDRYLKDYIDTVQCMGRRKNPANWPTTSQLNTKWSQVKKEAKLKALKTESLLKDLVAQTLNALLVLVKLLRYSSLVCHAVVALKSQLADPVMRDDQHNQQTNFTADSSMWSQLDNDCLTILQNCDILDHLCKMVKPCSPECYIVSKQVLIALAILAEKAEIQQIDKFAAILSPDTLGGCFDNQVPVSIATAAVHLLAVLSRSPRLHEQFFIHDEPCLLLKMFESCERVALTTHKKDRLHLTNALFELLSAILASDKDTAALLFESDCECSCQVIKCVTVILHHELEAYYTDKCEYSLALLRCGLCVLHQLASNDRMFTRHHEKECKAEFISVICGIDRLLKTLPSVQESEVALVYDLWDFDQDIDTDEETNDKDKNLMEH